MAKRLESPEWNLFDVIEKEEILEHLRICTHQHERRSLTVWPGQTCERMTMTCETCGQVRGRYPGE
jgi:hypothetical protein